MTSITIHFKDSTKLLMLRKSNGKDKNFIFESWTSN
jgi:hypothetical protein